MSRIAAVWLLAAAIVGLGLLWATVGSAQLTRLVGPEREALIYDGDLDTDSGGIEVTSWGSGTAEPVYDEHYVGPQVLKVKSDGPYQGIVLHLARPAPLGEFLGSPDSYLDVRVLPAQAPRLRETAAQAAQRGQAGRRAAGGRAGGMRGGMGGGRMGGAGGGMRGGMGGGRMGGAGGGMRGGMGGGMRGGMGMGGGEEGGGRGAGVMGGGMRRNIPAGGRRQAERLGWAGAGGRRATSRATAAAPGGPQPSGAKGFTARNLRIALFTDQGVMVADPVRLGALPKDERGWIPVSAALSRFEGARGASTVRAVGIFADDSEVFYLGQVRMVVDRTPVHATLKAEPSITNVDRVIDFSVELRGGPIDPEVSWDFDKSDGVQRQAVGANVKYIYKKAGDYQVTCTVTDRSGAREPMVATTGIHIEGS